MSAAPDGAPDGGETLVVIMLIDDGASPKVACIAETSGLAGLGLKPDAVDRNAEPARSVAPLRAVKHRTPPWRLRGRPAAGRPERFS